jgi:hypothetical protein
VVGNRASPRHGFSVTQVATALVLFWIWEVSLSRHQKVLSVLTATAFAIEEWLFIGVTDGLVKVHPAQRVSSHALRTIVATGHSSFAMWFLNLAYYRLGIVWFYSSWHVGALWLARALLFPVNVWFCEIVGGYYLDKVWQTRAWCYTGKRYAMFDGHIRLDYYPVWILLGLMHETLQAYLYVPLADWFLALH